MNYYELPLLKDLYLEDSYVLAIQEENDSLVFLLDAVLTEENPLYKTPEKDEQYCYKKAFLSFKEISFIAWIEKNFQKFKDFSGEVDYGNIDNFKIDNDICYLSGDWGIVELKCKNIGFEWR